MISRYCFFLLKLDEPYHGHECTSLTGSLLLSWEVPWAPSNQFNNINSHHPTTSTKKTQSRNPFPFFGGKILQKQAKSLHPTTYMRTTTTITWNQHHLNHDLFQIYPIIINLRKNMNVLSSIANSLLSARNHVHMVTIKLSLQFRVRNFLFFCRKGLLATNQTGGDTNTKLQEKLDNSHMNMIRSRKSTICSTRQGRRSIIFFRKLIMIE